MELASIARRYPTECVSAFSSYDEARRERKENRHAKQGHAVLCIALDHDDCSARWMQPHRRGGGLRRGVGGVARRRIRSVERPRRRKREGAVEVAGGSSNHLQSER